MSDRARVPPPVRKFYKSFVLTMRGVFDLGSAFRYLRKFFVRLKLHV